MNNIIKKIKEYYNLESDGQAIKEIIALCNNTPYIDFDLMSIKEIRQEVNKYLREQKEEY